MLQIDKRITEIGGTDIKYKEIKNTVITEISFKIKGKRKRQKIRIDGGLIGLKVLPIKDKYKPKFIEHQEKIDAKIKEMNQKLKPKIKKYKKEIEIATNKELDKQIDKQIKEL